MNELKRIITLLCVILLVSGCSDKANSVVLKKTDFNASHEYSKKEVKGIIKLPKDIIDKTKLKISMSMLDGKAENIKIKPQKSLENYSFTQKIPKEGTWSIKYVLTYKNQTIIKKYVEKFGNKNTDKKKIKSIELSTNPEPVVSHRDTMFNVNLFNNDNRIIKDADVILQIQNDDANFIFTKKMKNTDGNYQANTLLPSTGTYDVTVHINYKDKHTMETIQLPVSK